MGKNRTCVICYAREKQRGGFFARFPMDVDRCRTWVKVIGNEDLAYLPIEKLHDLRYVCADHFEKKDFNKTQNRLNKSAIPKLKLPSTPLTDEQLKEFPLHVPSKRDAAISEQQKSVENAAGTGLAQPRTEDSNLVSDSVPAIPQTLSSAEQAFEQLENYEVETLDDALPDISGVENYEQASDSEAAEPGDVSIKKQNQLQDAEEFATETPEIEQEPPSWSSVKDVCRACLSKSGAWDLTETYLTEDGENERLLDMLTLCYGIQLSNVSECSASRFLCDVCAASLRHADSFRRQVRRAEGSFADYYGADDEIKEEYLDFDENETLTEEVCTNNESMEQDFSTTPMNTQTSRNISEPSVNRFPKEQTKPSVDGSTKTAPQNNSMSEVSYSDKYIRVISYSANENVENDSANKEINIERQPAEEFEDNDETSNTSNCDEDLLYSDIKRRKIEQSKQNVTHPIHTTQPEKSTNVLQTVKRDLIDLRQSVKVANPKKNVRTIQSLLKTNLKTMKRKNSSDMNIGGSDQNVSNTITQLEKSVQQSVGSDSIDFGQSVKITLPGNKVIKFLPISTKHASSVVTKLGGKEILLSGVPVPVKVVKKSTTTDAPR